MEGGPRVPAGNFTQDYAQAIAQSFNYPSDTTPASNAAGRPHMPRDSLLDGWDGMRGKNIDMRVGSCPTYNCGVNHEFERSGEESQMPSSSGHPTESARGSAVPGHYGGRQNVQHRSSLELDRVKHKIFISHSGAQKDFAEQLCVDLERQGFLCPFFDLRQHSLPKGKDFGPLIKEAARSCHVAVMVLSEEYLLSKWPMIELAEFHGAQEAGNRRLNMLPLFYKLSVKDLDEKAIAERWMPMWTELYGKDARVDLAEWSAAVRALRKVNGEVFGKKGWSEVAYRKDIVKSIFELSPPDLLFGSSRKMVGYSRVCETVRDRFVRGISGGPSFLGLYGSSGVGKTTLCKALCDESHGEYMGRVCYVDLVEGQRMGKPWDEDLNAALRLRRVKRILERLCGLDKKALKRITDVDEGLTVMETLIEWKPVFLVIDNVTSESSVWNEANGYLGVRFHPESRIVITSQSKQNIRNLVPDIHCCVAMPSLSATEAGELFLRSAAPSMSIIGLTPDERRIVGLCIEECMYYDPDEGGEATFSGEDEVGLLLEVHVHNSTEKSFHPLALLALGDFFRRYFSNSGMLEWSGYLEGNKDPLWDVWKSRDGIGGIFGLQFHSLSSKEQLLFLDIAIFTEMYEYIHHSQVFLFRMLCEVHEETKANMTRRLQDLERCRMITLDWEDYEDVPLPFITMHDTYRGLAERHMTNHRRKELKNAKCVFESQGFTFNVVSDLVRLQMIDVDVACARVLTCKMVDELYKLQVLVVDSCHGMKELNLEGLVSLQYLLIKNLDDLERVTLEGNGGIYSSLRYVFLIELKSLVYGPDIRRCTSLVQYHVDDCPYMMNMDGIECPYLKNLRLSRLVGHQLSRLPNVRALCSLDRFSINSKCAVIWTIVEASRGVWLRYLGKPYLTVVEELVMYLRTEWVVNTIPNIQHSSFGLNWFNINKNEESLTLYDYNGMKYRWGDDLEVL